MIVKGEHFQGVRVKVKGEHFQRVRVIVNERKVSK